MKINWWRVGGCVPVALAGIALVGGNQTSGPPFATIMILIAFLMWQNEDADDRKKS